MTWSARIWLLGFAAAINMVTTGCGHSWPEVSSVADHQFMNRQRAVTKVDVLPIDIQLWTYPGNQRTSDELADSFTDQARTAIHATLENRGYDVVANIGWDGSYLDHGGAPGWAMSEDAVAATAYSLSGYGHAVAEAEQGILVPYLPARLGGYTGSDATLYVGGWAYVGEDRGSGTGTKVAKGILIGALIIVVIAVVIIGLEKSGGSGGRVAGAAGRAAGGAGRAAVKVASGLGRGVARAGTGVLRGLARGGQTFTEGMARSMDVMGRTNTHIEIYGGRPDYFEEDRSPRKGPSRTYVEMTLVDNATGCTLWHARQTFAASAGRSGQVAEMIQRMMATFPISPGP